MPPTGRVAEAPAMLWGMRLLGSLLLALLTPALAWAGPEASPPPQAGLDSFFLMQGLSRLAAHDAAGLGLEAGEVSAWAAGRSAVAIHRTGEGHELWDGSAAKRLSPQLAEALRRLGDYMKLGAATRLNPVMTADLRVMASGPATVARIRELFAQAISEAIVLDGELVVPELGGDALLVGRRLELHSFNDPTRVALRAVAERQADPAALAALFAEQSESLSLLDQHGQLEREVALFRERAERGVSLERRRRPFDMAVDTVLRNGSDTFTMHPREQLVSVIEHEWTEGRLVGLWHLHPPSWSPGGFLAAAPPSPDDRQIARANGQFLTIVFRPDGFDLHDLQSSPFGPAPSATAERLIEYRSEAWRAFFARLYAQGE